MSVHAEGLLENSVKGLLFSDLSCSVDTGVQRLPSLHVEELICKRPADFRTPRRRHHEHKLQRTGSTTIESLNLEPLRESACGTLSRSASGNYSVSTLSICSSGRIATCRTDRSLELSGQQILNESAPLPNCDEVTTGHLLKHASSNSTTITTTSDDGCFIAKSGKSNSIEMFCNEFSTVAEEDDMFPLTQVDRDVRAQELVIRETNRHCIPISYSKSRRSSFSITTDSEGGGYVESDCEGYSVAKGVSKTTSIESNAALPNIAADNQKVVEIEEPTSTLNDEEDDDDCLLISEPYYTYSPKTHFGVFRLFFQSDANNTSGNEQSNIPHRIVINKSPFVVGGENSCDLVFEREKYRHIFGRHCKLVFTECESDDPELLDLGITAYSVDVVKINPEATIFVNNVPVRMRTELKNGDIISFCPKKFAITFSVEFRTREACIALLNQMSSLMLTPSSGLQNRRQAVTPSLLNDIDILQSVESHTNEGFLEFNVNIAVFELYRGEPTIGMINSNSPCSFLSPKIAIKVEPDCDNATGSDYGTVLTPLLEKVRNCKVREDPIPDGMVLDRTGDQSPSMPLRIKVEECPLTPMHFVSRHYADDTSVPCNLLLNTYTTALNRVNLEDTQAKRGGHTSGRKDEASLRLDANKIARLRALNRHCFPIVVDSSRSLSSSCDSGRITVQKLRYIGVVTATYQSTLNELLPSINNLLQGGSGKDSNIYTKSPKYNVLVKRMEDPLTDEECRYSWVFQLDFFDKDDPLFRRAIYSSQREVESDKTKLHSLVTDMIDQLDRARVLYIQSGAS